MPTHVFLDATKCGLKRDSVVLCESPERVSKERLGNYITTLSDEIMRKIAVGSLLASAVISFLDETTLLATLKKAKQLNRVAA